MYTRTYTRACARIRTAKRTWAYTRGSCQFDFRKISDQTLHDTCIRTGRRRGSNPSENIVGSVISDVQDERVLKKILLISIIFPAFAPVRRTSVVRLLYDAQWPVALVRVRGNATTESNRNRRQIAARRFARTKTAGTALCFYRRITRQKKKKS